MPKTPLYDERLLGPGTVSVADIVVSEDPDNSVIIKIVELANSGVKILSSVNQYGGNAAPGTGLVTLGVDMVYINAHETDPVFTASPAYGITSANITSWNTAYGWGDHSVQGYLKTVSWSAITGKPTFATVATTGSYNDLSNKPTIPTYGSGDFIQNQGAVAQTANFYITGFGVANKFYADIYNAMNGSSSIHMNRGGNAYIEHFFNGNFNRSISFNANVNVANLFALTDSGTSWSDFVISNTGGTSPGHLSFKAGTTTHRFTSAGNFLVGTTTDNGQKLQVNGGASVASLAGTGSRMVVADDNGILSTSSIPSSGGTYTASNGLTMTSSNIILGGTLTVDTTITGAGKYLYIDGLSSGRMKAVNGAITTGVYVTATEAYIFNGNSTSTGNSFVTAKDNEVELLAYDGGYTQAKVTLGPGFIKNETIGDAIASPSFNIWNTSMYNGFYFNGLETNSVQTYIITQDADGKIWRTLSSGITGSGGTTYTFANGLTNTSGTVGLGGTLTGNTTIDTTANYYLKINGTNTSTLGTFQVTSTTSTGVYSQNNGNGHAVYGNNFGTGYGVYGQSQSGAGVYAEGKTTTPLKASLTIPTSGNTVMTVLELYRGVSGGVALDGMGQAIDFYMRSTTTSQLAGRLISKWTTAADATRTSQFEIWGVNNAVSARKMAISGNGQLTLDGYTSAVSGTAVYGLGVDASGNVITTSLSGGTYTLPIASASTLGGIKVGSGLAIDGTGILSATGAVAPTYNMVEVNDTDYTVAAGVTHVWVSKLTANRTLTLPSASANTNRKIVVKHGGGNVGGTWVVNYNVSVVENVSTTGSSLGANKFQELISNGTNWVIVANN